MNKNKYQYSLCFIEDKPVILSYGRNKKLSNDLYAYEIMSSNDGMHPEILKKNVFINHYASILSKDPILKDVKDSLFLTEENFKTINLNLTLDEYINLSENEVQFILNLERSNHDHTQILG